MEDSRKTQNDPSWNPLGFKYSADWYANKYHWNPPEDQMKDPGPGQYKERDTACILAMEIKEGDSILIPGCSEANNISLLKSMYRNLRITGVDWSATAIRFCRQAFPEFTFIHSNVSELDLPIESFDRILAIDFTEHLSLDDYFTFINMSYMFIRPDGTLGILPGMSVRPEHINLMYPPTIAQHIEQHGFETIAVGPQWVIGKKPKGR